MTGAAQQVGAAGVAYGDGADTRELAAALAREAVERAGVDSVDLALVFHTPRHDAHDVYAAVREVVGDAAGLLGGSAPGVIVNERLGYEAGQIGVAVLGDTGAPIRVVAERGLGDRGEAAVGAALGEAVAAVATGSEADLLLTWSSIVRGITDPEGMALYMATPLLGALLAALPGHGVVAGSGLIDALVPGPRAWTLTPEGPAEDAAAVAVLERPLSLHTTVIHGCRPAGSYHRITASDGPVVLEIDGRPALDVLDELVGGDRASYPFRVMFGVNRGERWGEYDPEAYQVRLCLALDEERGGIVMFEPDLEPGAEVQLMRTAADLDYVEERVRALLGRLDGRRPLLALYADCAGRTRAVSGHEVEEAEAVQRALGEIPLLGWYTGVEVSPVAGRPQPLDWTGVLCLIGV